VTLCLFFTLQILLILCLSVATCFANIAVNTDRLAAVWPTIGIIIEVIVLVIFIAICEVRSRRKAAEDDDKCK